MTRIRRRSALVGVAAAAVLATANLVLAAGPSPVETLASTTASVLPDQTAATDGWLQPDFVDDPTNPVDQFNPVAGQTTETDRIFPTVMRVDDKLANPLDRWYMWVWRHGLYPRNVDNGGRMILLTAPRLEGPWTHRGFVTSADMEPPGYGPYSLTGGDVVWSPKYHRFFSVPHASSSGCFTGTGGCTLDSFLMESPDGVNWTFSSTTAVLPTGPSSYDNFETGYGKLLRVDEPDGTERWIWLYRSGRGNCGTCNQNNEYYTLSVATANDIYGPWTKASYNPVFDPFANNQVAEAAGMTSSGGILGIDAFVYLHGYYQLLWQDFLGDVYLSRSADLRNWEDFAPQGTQTVRPTGRHRNVPVFKVPHGPDAVVLDGADLVYDDQVGALTLLYLGWDANQVQSKPGVVSINLARSASEGGPIPGRNE